MSGLAATAAHHYKDKDHIMHTTPENLSWKLIRLFESRPMSKVSLESLELELGLSHSQVSKQVAAAASGQRKICRSAQAP